MPSEQLTQSLGENILTLLALDKTNGKLIAGLIDATLFSNDLHQLIARRVLDYWRQHHRPPGRVHTPDLLADILEDRRHPQNRAVRDMLASMMMLFDSNINTTYVLDQLQSFVRLQEFKRAVLESAQQLESRQELALSDVETMWGRILRTKQMAFEPGMRLGDFGKMLEWMERRAAEFTTGVKTLDDAGVVPARGSVMLLLGSKGCLVGETLVDCPRDLSRYPKGVPIKDLVGKRFLTYSWDFERDKLVLSKVLRVWRTGIKPVYRVKLSATPGGQKRIGKKGGGTQLGDYLPPMELVGTFDHPIMLADGRWYPLGRLRPGDSLKSLYRRRESSKGGYSLISWSDNVERLVNPRATKPGATTYFGLVRAVREHKFVCEWENGPEPPNSHAHHKDENSYNHSPYNLEWKDAIEHFSEHARDRNLRGEFGWQIHGRHPRGMLGKNHTKEIKRRIRNTLAITRQQVPNHKVLSVEYVGNREVFDMEVEGTSNFVANGVFVHNSGKSHFLVNVAKRAFRENKRVLYVSLEMKEPLVLQRLYQSLFAVPKNSRVRLARMSRIDLDHRDQFAGIIEETVEPEWALDSPIAEAELAAHLMPFGVKVDNLIVKKFPRSSLTVDRLRAYLDGLELVENFIPDIICLDYFGLMNTDVKNPTTSLTKEFEEFCGLLEERNMAGVTAQQLTRKGASAMVAGSTQVAQSWQMVGAADDVLVQSASEAERVRGLARLAVNHSRESDDHWTSLLCQNYPLCQYCIESIRLPDRYQEYISSLSEREPEQEEDSDE